MRITLRQQLRFREAVQQMVLDHIHEVRRVVIVLPLRWPGCSGALLGLLHLLRGDEPVFHHLRQHAVPRFRGALRAAVRARVAIGRANNARQKGGFVHRDVADVLVEIGQRAFRESMNGEAAAIAEVDLIGVKLEDLPAC